ncbi:DUF6861 domain-containing protein [Methylomonas sp. AM2-LC]|uniref:DUF6861 domain-containing protein n=1 Tax=Methylomonas sp. AM2-LC TaxID=3153301 RepID=UPI003266627F
MGNKKFPDCYDTWNGQRIHPNAPAGGGGPGIFKTSLPLGVQSLKPTSNEKPLLGSPVAKQLTPQQILSPSLFERIDAIKSAYTEAILKAPAAIYAETGYQLGLILKSFLPGLLNMLKVLGISTIAGAAIGGGIGFLFGGIGAAPGAVVGGELGIEIATAVFTWMGLGFLVVAIVDGLTEFDQVLLNAVRRAWHAPEHTSPTKQNEINAAASELARAVGIIFRLMLQGILAYVLKKGAVSASRASFATVGSVSKIGVNASADASMAELSTLLKNSKLPPEFSSWLEKNWDDISHNQRLQAQGRLKSASSVNQPMPGRSGTAESPSSLSENSGGKSASSGESTAAKDAEAVTETSNETACPVGSKCSKAGEPISMVTGEEMLERVDFTWEGPLPLIWRRFYRSGQSDRNLQLGFGWLTPLDEWLDVGERASYRNADGQSIDLPLPAVGRYSVNVPEQIRLYRDVGQFRIVDASGLEHVFSGTEGRCRLSAWQNHYGQSLHFHWNGGVISRISTNWNKHLLLERQGNLIVALQPAERNGSDFVAIGEPLVAYAYSESADLVAVFDRLKQGETYAYNQHLLVKRSLPSAFSFYFEWNAETPQAKCLRNYGDNGIYDYRFEWLPDGISHAINSHGGVSVYQHNAEGQLIYARSPEGLEIRYHYNAAKLLVQTNAPGDAVTRFAYDTEGRLTSMINAVGHSQRFKYNKQGQLVEVVDALNQRWLRHYDQQGRLEETIAANGAVTRYSYNQQGLMTKVVNALGQARSLLWDQNMRLLGETSFDGFKTRYQYDLQGRIIAIISQDKQTTRYDYDALDRIIAVHYPDGSTTKMRYNVSGHLSHFIDAQGNTTEYRYDEGLPQPSARINPLGQEMRYCYDAERNLTALINAKGETYSLSYDKDENLLSECGFDGRLQHYRYNNAGQLAAHLQATENDEWQITHFERDRLGRLLKKSAPDGSVTQYGYDQLGRLQLAKNSDNTVLLGYNVLGLVNQENQNGALVRHKYDLLGRRILTDTPDQHRIEYCFGERYLDSISFNGQTLSAHGYDEWGREVKRSQGLLDTHFDYDPLGRLLRQRTVNHVQDRTVLGRQYSYDVAGKLNMLEDLRQGINQYHYDPAARLIRTEGLNPELFVHDPAGNLLGANPETGLVVGDRLMLMGDRHYRYDDAGNLIEEKRGKEGKIVTRYHYNSDNRLFRAETPQGSTDYRYDALGRRIAKLTPQGETRFVYDGPRLLAEIDGQRSRTYVFEPGSFRPLAFIEQESVKATSAIYHYHLDHLGTPRELTDAQGKIVWSAQYRAYGNLALADVAEIDNPLRFQGQYYDQETGLQYNLNRYYDPNAGRYIHQDPIGLVGGDNVYIYTQNPTNWIDPFGLDWNYFLTNSDGKVYYHGRASDNATMQDVINRHANNIGSDGARFGEGDTITQVTAYGTDYDLVRGIEQRGIEENNLLGRGSDDVRGNLINGISEAKQSTPKGISRLDDADVFLSQKGVSKVSELPALKAKCY